MIFLEFSIVSFMLNQNREERRGDFHRMDSSPGQLGTPGSRTSSVLPDLLTQVCSSVFCCLCKNSFQFTSEQPDLILKFNSLHHVLLIIRKEQTVKTRF